MEARLLASLMARPMDEAVDISITCEGGVATANASVGSPEARRSVLLSGPIAAETILALAEQAVLRLLSPAPIETVAAAPSAEPVRTEAGSIGECASPAVALAVAPRPLLASENTAPGARRPAVEEDRESRVRADFSVQSWGSHAAGGAALGLEQTVGAWSYAFLAGGARPFTEQTVSRVSEWTAAAELAWQRRDFAGIRWSTRVGLSVLTASPDRGVAVIGEPLKSAGFLELDLSRPLWFGRFGLAPGLGVRAFSAKRAISSDGQPDFSSRRHRSTSL